MDHVSELFGSNVFNDDVMKQRLPRETYQQLQLTIKQGKHLDSAVANIVAKANSNIMNLNITYRTVSYFEILLDIEVKNVEQLNNLVTALKSAKSISYVSRANK